MNALTKFLVASATIGLASAFGGMSSSPVPPSSSVPPSGEGHQDGGACVAATGPGRIVNGEDAFPDEYPFLVVAAPAGSLCGGSLIAPEWVLTANHCSYGADPRGYEIYVGANKYYWGDTDGTMYNVVAKFEHPEFNYNTLDNDITLLKLDRPVTETSHFLDYHRAAEFNRAGACVTVAGYGTTSSGSDVADHAMTVGLAMVDQPMCNDMYSGELTENMICAYDENQKGGQDSCQGDSGGPLFTRAQDGAYVQVGIVSWGYGCADPNYPGIYTNVANYVEYIDDIINNN